jgi:hypothetical protein
MNASIETDLTRRKLGRYEVISRLGAGGMGVVYRARDTRLKRDVALKVLPAASVTDPERKRRFVQEARAASALNHPNIVTIYDIDQIDGIDFITMECVPGKALAEVIGRKGLPVAEAIAYAIQIAGALAAAHAAGIIHRDLKPGNIMANVDGQLKVLDSGLAKLLAEPPEGGASTDTAWIAGTPAYMSPEQAEGKKVDARSDIFSFWCIALRNVDRTPGVWTGVDERDHRGHSARYSANRSGVGAGHATDRRSLSQQGSASAIPIDRRREDRAGGSRTGTAGGGRRWFPADAPMGCPCGGPWDLGGSGGWCVGFPQTEGGTPPPAGHTGDL